MNSPRRPRGWAAAGFPNRRFIGLLGFDCFGCSPHEGDKLGAALVGTAWQGYLPSANVWPWSGFHQMQEKCCAELMFSSSVACLSFPMCKEEQPLQVGRGELT